MVKKSDLRQFPCDGCGKCCQFVNLSEQTQFLDRGDGTCRYFDKSSNHCLIYNERPAICRVDKQYQLCYSEQYSWEEFIQLNVAICDYLKKL